MNISNEEIGGRIWELRRARGMTREKLAEKAEISVQFLADIEKGRKSMTVATLKGIASALLVPTDLIVFGAEHETDGTDPELAELIATLTSEQQKAAARILKVFAEEINRK